MNEGENFKYNTIFEEMYFFFLILNLQVYVFVLIIIIDYKIQYESATSFFLAGHSIKSLLLVIPLQEERGE